MLSATSEYALRALIRMSQVPEGAAILGRDLADEARIPQNYLAKILLALRHAGIVTAHRGTGGGYGLSKRPEEIRLLDVVELFDGTQSRPRCLLGEHERCSEDTPCAAHESYRALREAHMRFLETTTIARIGRASGKEKAES
ncbi:MAG: Rrf2 family transcriptional regulator [Acidobacteria bacterium]|nr:Rrf2 family transcriptional regulator [Acidobacteriota bacterium]MBI3469980.1 Rrf2 family transcriptional regulator [Candidatus Solibacter usitatus]